MRSGDVFSDTETQSVRSRPTTFAVLFGLDFGFRPKFGLRLKSQLNLISTHVVYVDTCYSC